MKTFIFSLLNLSVLCILAVASAPVWGQTADSLHSGEASDTSDTKLNMEAVYDRPFLSLGKMPVGLGGYLEANSIYRIEEGITEGLSFQARRLTMFMSASISKRIQFLSELEFEEGGKEIAIEFAAMDVSVHPLLNFRGGIVLNPIGAFNQNHDGPKWEFVERPDVAVNMLAATFSNVGFGLFGKAHTGDWVFGYEAYATNGFDNRIVDNEMNRTFLPAVKENGERFEESNSGRPLLSGKIALKNRKIGEVGISYMGHVYNKFEEDGLTLDEKRDVRVLAVDFNTTVRPIGTYIVGEAALVMVDVPETYTQQFGDRQHGFFIDVVQPILKRKMFDWEQASLNLAVRWDYVDWNVGTFRETGGNIGDEILAVTPAISFRPSPQTVFRLNYRYEWRQDILNNPPIRAATWYAGFSTYF